MTTEQLLFILFVAVIFVAVVAIAARYAGRGITTQISLAIAAWLAYVCLLSKFGILQRDTLPPGMAFILVPVVAYLLAVISINLSGRVRWVLTIPVSLLIGAQSFRIGVELLLHQLWKDGVVPQMLTFSGANVDIYIGASALIVAPLATRGRFGRRAAMAWNVLGLVALVNVVTRAITTAPGPLNLIHSEPPNRMFITFPFMFIPAFFVPLAVSLHLYSLRSLLHRVHDEQSSVPAANLNVTPENVSKT